MKLRFGGRAAARYPPLLGVPLLMITLFQYLQQTINSYYHISICTPVTMLRRVFPSVSYFLLSLTKVKSFLCRDRSRMEGVEVRNQLYALAALPPVNESLCQGWEAHWALELMEGQKSLSATRN